MTHPVLTLVCICSIESYKSNCRRVEFIHSFKRYRWENLRCTAPNNDLHKLITSFIKPQTKVHFITVSIKQRWNIKVRNNIRNNCEESSLYIGFTVTYLFRESITCVVVLCKRRTQEETVQVNCALEESTEEEQELFPRTHKRWLNCPWCTVLLLQSQFLCFLPSSTAVQRD